MDNEAITLLEAIEQVEKWLAYADKQCTLHSGGGVGNTIYTIYLAKWNSLKDVAQLLSKIETREEF